MKTKTYKEDSWHFRLATVYGTESKSRLLDERTNINICEYSKFVLRGFISALLVAVLIGFTLGSLFDFGLELILHFQYGLPMDFNNIFVTYGMVFTISPVIIGVFYLIFKIIDLYQEHKRSPTTESFFFDAYSSFKEKFCFKVAFSPKKTTENKDLEEQNTSFK